MSKLAILAAGGPAPGINSVIGAATIRACLSGVSVLGVQDGFKWIMKGDTSRVTPLTIGDTSRIHFRGGSMLGVSRSNPTKRAEDLERTKETLKELGVSMLITIGGDDTAYSAFRLSEISAGSIRVVHVPKTIDNDLDLPDGTPTFGYTTARSLGCEIVQSLMVDARTTGRWYIVVAMGRKAGHLALGIGKAAGATITLVPEEFSGQNARLDTIVDTLAGSIIKRLADGRSDGVAVLAEGLVEILPESDLAALANVERDEHDHIRIAEIDFGEIVRRKLRDRLKKLGVEATLVSKNIGYELRCADPVPTDMEYTRDLGYCAARYVIEGGTKTLIAMVAGKFTPIPFDRIMDPQTHRMRVRMVDLESDRYRIARTYMLRLRRADRDNPAELTRLARVVGMTPEAFAAEFEHIFRTDLDPIRSLSATPPPVAPKP